MNPEDEQHTAGLQGDRGISLENDYEVQYWTLALDVSKDELAALVQQHGSSARRIRDALLAARETKIWEPFRGPRSRAAQRSRTSGS